LNNAIIIIFDELFHLCEVNNYEYDFFLWQRRDDRTDEKVLDSLTICRYTQSIIDLVAYFVRDYCQNNPSLLIALIETLNTKQTWNRNHICNKSTIETTFCSTNNESTHICDKTILELLLMYSIFLSSKSCSLIEFLQILLRVSKDFQIIFIDMYLSF
jgi:hypothetical protein